MIATFMRASPITVDVIEREILHADWVEKQAIYLAVANAPDLANKHQFLRLFLMCARDWWQIFRMAAWNLDVAASCPRRSPGFDWVNHK